MSVASSNADNAGGQSQAHRAPPRLAGETLCYMVHRLLDFREADIQAAAEAEGVSKEKLRLRLLPGDHPFSPLRLIDSPSEDTTLAIAQRAILAKGLFEIWGSGSSLEELKESLRECPAHIMQPWLAQDKSFKFVVDGFGRRFSVQEQIKLMHDVTDVCPLQGPVDLSNPRVKIWVIVINTTDGFGMPQEVPYRMIVAREINQGSRSGIQAFTLKKRRYLGPTSMDFELSFLMCNAGLVRRHALVYDPFAGTGSILVSAAASGAAVIGGDIDVRVIRDGKVAADGCRVNVYSNFADYGLPDPAGLLRIDAANPPWRRDVPPFLDAVLCDPPYGVRAGGRKMVPRAPGSKETTAKHLPQYIPATSPYGLGECLRDLLDTAARLLVPGGRLVYWMPDFNEDSARADGDGCAAGSPEHDILGSIHRDPTLASRGEKVPSHPCLQILNNSVQVLSSRYIRRMITMQKRRDYNEEEALAWRSQLGDPTMAIDQIHDIVYEARSPRPAPEKPNKKRFRGKVQ